MSARGDDRIVAVVGPTAAGKAELGMRMAERLGRALWVCDSVKVYRGLDIGSAKPSEAARRRVPHELLDLVDPDREFTAGDWARAMLALLEAEGPGVVVGGSGFYLRSALLTYSGDAHLAGDDDVEARRRFEDEVRRVETEAPGSALARLLELDPELAAEIDRKNMVRIVRALWLCTRHGEPISAVRRRDPPRPRFPLLMVVLDPGAEALDRAIVDRVDRMLAAGWLDEVARLHARGYHEGHRAMGSLGYRELLGVVQGHTSLAEARKRVLDKTRDYARRQRVYFRTQIPADHVFRVEDLDRCPWDAVQAFVDGAAVV